LEKSDCSTYRHTGGGLSAGKNLEEKMEALREKENKYGGEKGELGSGRAVTEGSGGGEGIWHKMCETRYLNGEKPTEYAV